MALWHCIHGHTHMHCKLHAVMFLPVLHIGDLKTDGKMEAGEASSSSSSLLFPFSETRPIFLNNIICYD